MMEEGYSDDEHDVYSEHFSGCDRRLSRAARSLLQKVILRLDDDEAPNANHDAEDVWTLLDDWLGRAATPKECPLLPTRDVLRHDEEQSLRIPSPTNNLNWAYPTTTLQQRRQKSPLRPKEWWQ